jgi:hypothetical protein
LQRTSTELSDPAALAFCRERLAAVSNALKGWQRCKRAVCQRAGECKGTSQASPRCVPFITASIRVYVSLCTSRVPELALPAPPKEPTYNVRLDQLMQRSMGILEHHIETMEKGIEGRRTDARR